MTWIKRFAFWTALIFAILFGLSFLIVYVIAPVCAVSFGLVYAACQSGNTTYLFVSMWVLPGLISLILSPFAIKYSEMKKRLDEYEKEEQEEMDADL